MNPHQSTQAKSQPEAEAATRKTRASLSEKIDSVRLLYRNSKTKPGAIALEPGEFDMLLDWLNQREAMVLMIEHLLTHNDGMPARQIEQGFAMIEMATGIKRNNRLF